MRQFDHEAFVCLLQVLEDPAILLMQIGKGYQKVMQTHQDADGDIM